jgi:hypothetical protein
MSRSQQNRRKTSAKKLEPIDWHEFANDAVLNGNMSTLYQRPPSEDATAYASPEALAEIRKRTAGSMPRLLHGGAAEEAAQSLEVLRPTVGPEHTVGLEPTVDTPSPGIDISAAQLGKEAPASSGVILEGPEVLTPPTVGGKPTVGRRRSRLAADG